jgi:hypothetical protein
LALTSTPRKVARAAPAVLAAAEAVTAEPRGAVVVLEAFLASISLRDADALEARCGAAVLAYGAALIAAEALSAGLQ